MADVRYSRATPVNTSATPFRPASDSALALADGRVFRGRGFGAEASASGEAVFTTTMTGYQEVCTDPSFRGQIVCMTYPLIGNYGVNGDDDESRQPWISGLVVREWSDQPSNWRSTGTLDGYLRDAGIPGIAGIDTRSLTRHIRSVGDTRAVLVRNAAGVSDTELVERARAAQLPGERDVVGEVMDAAEHVFGETATGPHVVVLDCGVKRNIVRSLVSRGARVTVVPYGTPYSRIEALAPDGVIVSPGPGDPANLDKGLDVVRSLLQDERPYFGICLGHQLLARAIGAETDKLKFGHRGGNQPVIDQRTGQVTITSQNHSYRVVDDTIPTTGGWHVALRNLNDDSVEGLWNEHLPVLSVQFHPEASPGPSDNSDLFDAFIELIASRAAGHATPAISTAGDV
ncbi:MAG: Carbamoyl-phosphate synthase small chain [uncultured Thermomicrobiales bacterium]|uniref:Carbamoyl phosphate synthase small chain n=1 Tax=uncultured Thermomicrobiales bacterium TaxID=1645740 RepID=A0A6J4U624_9BACT|nr:MAG: Carbamoyl-phosphate synthase small chain [uncultured Thermomicrobiales bacterium]